MRWVGHLGFIVIYWAIWGPLDRQVGKAGWPYAIQAAFIGAVFAIAVSLAFFVGRRLGKKSPEHPRFIALRLGVTALFIATMLYFPHRSSMPAPWMMALIVLAFVAFDALLQERSRRVGSSLSS